MKRGLLLGAMMFLVLFILIGCRSTEEDIEFSEANSNEHQMSIESDNPEDEDEGKSVEEAIQNRQVSEFAEPDTPTNKQTKKEADTQMIQVDHAEKESLPPKLNVLNEEQKVIQLMNMERENKGLKPLEADLELMDVARFKSEDMRDNNYFDVESPKYGSISDILNMHSVTYSGASINMTAGPATPQEIVQGWMENTNHREAILNPDLTHVGSGYAHGGNKNHYLTLFLIKKYDYPFKSE